MTKAKLAFCGAMILSLAALMLMIVPVDRAQSLAGQGTGYGDGAFVPGVAYSANQFLGRFFTSPRFTSSTASLVVTRSSGVVFAGRGKVGVASGSTTLTASKTSCARPLYSSCNFIYSNSSGTIANTVTFSTAVASGNSILAFAETDGTGVTSLEAAYQNTAGYMPRLAQFSATLSPASVAANTCAEELFTVTGVETTDVVYVNKPTAQAGLGVAGARASGANQVGINFCNATAAPIVPTASQAYLIGVLR